MAFVFADVDVGRLPVGAPRHPRACIGDQHRGRCAQSVALVATQDEDGVDRIDESVGEMARRAFTGFEALGHCREHLRADEDVALRDVVATRAMPGPGVRAGAGVLGAATVHRDDPDLPLLKATVGGEQPLERRIRRLALGEGVEQLVAVLGARAGLRGHGPDAFAHPRYAVAHTGHAGGDRHAHLAGARINRGNREGVEHEGVAPRVRLLGVRGHGRRRRDEQGGQQGGTTRHEGLQRVAYAWTAARGGRGVPIVGRQPRRGKSIVTLRSLRSVARPCANPQFRPVPSLRLTCRRPANA